MSNCIRNKNKGFSLNEWTSLKQTGCNKTVSENASEKVGQYALSNFNSCECTAEQQRQLSIVHPTVPFRDGCGWTSINGCNIDKDSDLRNARNLTNTREIHQLQPREVLTEPLKSKGSFNTESENKLIFSEPTTQKRQTNSLSGVTIDRFIPQLDIIKKNIQNTKHLIPEDNNKSWIRGGIDTRNIIRDANRNQRSKREFILNPRA
jgi:hypothetical protein